LIADLLVVAGQEAALLFDKIFDVEQDAGWPTDQLRVGDDLETGAWVPQLGGGDVK